MQIGGRITEVTLKLYLHQGTVNVTVKMKIENNSMHLNLPFLLIFCNALTQI